MLIFDFRFPWIFDFRFSILGAAGWGPGRHMDFRFSIWLQAGGLQARGEGQYVYTYIHMYTGTIQARELREPGQVVVKVLLVGP